LSVNADFGDAASFLSGLKEISEQRQGRIDILPDQDRAYDAVIVVLNEGAYAEGAGDMLSWVSTAASQRNSFYGADILSGVKNRFPNVPVVSVYVGGRPLWMTPQINASDAFVVAWLPGTQGAGIADGLFGESEIDGMLPMNWPKDDCEGEPTNVSHALFSVGYGLTFESDKDLPQLPAREAMTIGSNGLALDCVWQNFVLHPVK
jgi:beta-glucosidase